MRHRHATYSSVVLLLAFVLGPGQPRVLADSPRKKTPPGDLTGVVLDPAGAPVPETTVWLIGGPDRESPQPLEKTVTDAQGRFTFSRARQKHLNSDRPSVTAFTRDSQGRIGGDEHPWNYHLRTPWRDIKIQLVEVQDFHGRVLDATGQPIAGASIRPKSFSLGPLEDRSRPSVPLFNALADELTCKTTADGRFTIRGAPANGSVGTRVTTAEFGSPWVIWNCPGPATLRLDRVGSVRGSLVAMGGASLEGVNLFLYRPFKPRENGSLRVYSNADTTSAADGAFHFDAVLPGKYEIHALLHESASPFVAKETSSVEVLPGQTTEGVSVPLSPIVVEVRGQVVDAVTGQGVQGVTLQVSHVSDQGHLISKRRAATDAEGRYLTYVEPAKITVNPMKAPDGYVLPRRQGRLRHQDATKAVTWPVVKLDRAVQLDGIVVDASGNPVADAEVHILRPGEGLDAVLEITDAKGKFTIGGLTSDAIAAVRARTETAVSDEAHVCPQDATGPVRLVVAEEKAVTLRGVCLDDAGRPAPYAVIRVLTSWPLGSTGVGGLNLCGGITDAEGRFEMDGLWPGYKHQLSVKDDAYKEFESADVVGKPGEVIDFGKLVLTSLGGFVAGKVVDSDGRPIDGVRVFNAGDAPAVISSQTDASGQFRLERLPSGAVYVFAEKEGYRFASARAAAKTTNLTITLLRTNETAPPWKPQKPPASLHDRQRVAKRLLEKLWATPKHGKTSWVIRYMARLDREQALAWSAELGGRYDSLLLRRQNLRNIAEADVDEALALLTKGNNRSFAALKSLANSVASSNPAAAMRLAEEAVLTARSLDQPDRTLAVAEVATLVTRLGKVEAGRKLLDEAASSAAKLGTEHRAYHRGIVAAQLAPHDLTRAMSLVEPIGDRDDRDDALSRIAAAVAPVDLKKALEIVDRVQKRSTLPDMTRLEIAYQLAPTRPEDAVRVVESMDSYAADKMRAEAYGWLAVAIAPRDKQLACSLIDRSFDIYRDKANWFRGWSSSGGRCAMAARVAAQAAEFGYPDMGALISRVLAMRPTEADSYSPKDAERSLVLAAKILAPVDPDVAKQLLESVPSPEESADSPQTVEPRDWLQAWALADLEHCAELCGRRLEAAREDPDFSLSGSGLSQALDVLTTPPEKQMEVLLRFNRFWFPGQGP